ncbi:hypothetical protein B0H10DRAFT_1941755 [Mycena sp. CBHHK59/15]|nr:hypothetical protein B0H10DRAFT_1941755 [Mycena sp. CBHHK59/15]
MNVQQYWLKNQEWVMQQMKSKRHTGLQSITEDMSILLGERVWGMMKPLDSKPFHSLWHFLGPHWLSGSQLNYMLEMLQFKIDSTLELVKDLQLHTLAEDLVANQAALITGAHLGPVISKPHWIAIVVDIGEGVICHGDSFQSIFNAPSPASTLMSPNAHAPTKHVSPCI